MGTGLHPMQSRKADRHNELMGMEIESKLKIISHHSINEVANLIFNTLQNSIGQYSIAPSLSIILLSKTIARHYGYQKNGKIKKVFTVTQRAKDQLLQIKRKGQKTLYYQNILSKTEYIEPLPWPQWTTEAELAVIQQEAKLLNGAVHPQHIFLVAGEVERQKLKIRVINNLNQRAYTIGVDKTTAPNGKTMQQIEIEYIGTELKAINFTEAVQTERADLVEMEIATEIKAIEQLVIGICSEANIRLKMTGKTKFKWLCEMLNANYTRSKGL